MSLEFWPLLIVFSFLLGSIPTGYLAGRILKGLDIRQYGSGNVGATNVYRLLGPFPAGVVLLIDMIKGSIPIILIGQIQGSTLLQILGGICAVLGHIYTPFLRFKGGKGVATAAGSLVALVPTAFLMGIAVFTLFVIATRYVSVGSIAAAISVPTFLLIQKRLFHQVVPKEILLFTFIIGLAVILKHIPNIRRLIQGTENRLSRFKK